MSRPRPIALTGLSPTEQVLLEGVLFQPASNQIPGAFLENDLARAELIIANADDAAAVRALKARGLPGRVLLLGASDAGTGWPVVTRPLRLHAVMEAARRVLAPPSGAGAGGGGRRARGDSEPPSFEATQPFMPGDTSSLPGFEPTRPFEPSRSPPEFEATQAFMVPRTNPARGAGPGNSPEPRSAGNQYEATQAFKAVRGINKDFEATQQFNHSVPSVAPSEWETEVAEWEEVQVARAAATGRDASASQNLPVEVPRQAVADVPTAPGDLARTIAATAVPEEPQQRDRILIVGQPGTAAGGLFRILKSAGFPADFVPDGETAFRHLARKAYGFVFLIEVSLGPEAISLCRAIQRQRGASSADLRLVIVASHRGLLSRIRAWFAGCNAWMAIPLDKTELLQYLRQYGTHETQAG
jgi:CheY-like chemotaxis protein